MVIQGYRLPTTDYQEIEAAIGKIRKKAETILSREFQKLIAEEAAFLCDNVSLNILERDPNTPILNSAIDNVRQRIEVAKINATGTREDFRLFVHILSDGDCTYFSVTYGNENLLGAFKGFEEYSVNESEMEDPFNQKTQKWIELQKKYDKMQPPVVEIGMMPDPKDKLTYPDVNSRCAVFARWQVTNHLLNQIAGGQQIPPFLLMRYLDTALMKVSDKEYEAKIRAHTEELKHILIDLNENDSIIREIPGMAVKEERDAN